MRADTFAGFHLWLLLAIVATSSCSHQEWSEVASTNDVQVLPMLYPGSKIFLPEQMPAPGILMMHGSEGGALETNDREAYSLAQQGFVVVTYCYFKCVGTPQRLHRINIDQTIAALSFLKSSHFVGGKKVGLFGVSRGAEKALLLASLMKSADLVSAVAVHAPSHTVVASFDPASQGPVYEPIGGGYYTFAPAWTYRGIPLFGERFDLSTPGPIIRIDEYPGPLMTSHGTNDEVWPSSRSEEIKNLRDEAGLSTQMYLFEGDGHQLSLENESEVRSKRYTFFKANLAQ